MVLLLRRDRFVADLQNGEITDTYTFPENKVLMFFFIWEMMGLFLLQSSFKLICFPVLLQGINSCSHEVVNNGDT